MTSDSPSIAVSNASPAALTVWLEPWCDELAVSPRSTLSITPIPPQGTQATLPAVDITGDVLTIWAACAGTMAVKIDGVEQDTGSRTIDLPPDLFATPVKEFVGLVFGNQPHARPGGAPAPAKQSFWSRLMPRWR